MLILHSNLRQKSLVIVNAVMEMMKPPLYMVSAQTQTKEATAAQCQGSACSMSKHRVSELIVISSLIRLCHLFFYAHTGREI